MRIGTFLLTFPIAYAWPVAHMVNSQTSPTVRITLDPPEDPLPQVTAQIQLLEKARLRKEEGYVNLLETTYNKQITLAHQQIHASVIAALRQFDAPSVKAMAIKGAMLPLTSPIKASAVMRKSGMHNLDDNLAFRQTDSSETTDADGEDSISSSQTAEPLTESEMDAEEASKTNSGKADEDGDNSQDVDQAPRETDETVTVDVDPEDFSFLQQELKKIEKESINALEENIIVTSPTKKTEIKNQSHIERNVYGNTAQNEEGQSAEEVVNSDSISKESSNFLDLGFSSIPPVSFVQKSTTSSSVSSTLDSTETNSEAPSFRVKIRPVKPPTVAVKMKLIALESKRSAEERQMIQQSYEEFTSLNKLLLTTLDRALSNQMAIFEVSQSELTAIFNYIRTVSKWSKNTAYEVPIVDDLATVEKLPSKKKATMATGNNVINGNKVEATSFIQLASINKHSFRGLRTSKFINNDHKGNKINEIEVAAEDSGDASADRFSRSRPIVTQSPIRDFLVGSTHEFQLNKTPLKKRPSVENTISSNPLSKYLISNNEKSEGGGGGDTILDEDDIEYSQSIETNKGKSSSNWLDTIPASVESFLNGLPEPKDLGKLLSFESPSTILTSEHETSATEKGNDNSSVISDAQIYVGMLLGAVEDLENRFHRLYKNSMDQFEARQFERENLNIESKREHQLQTEHNDKNVSVGISPFTSDASSFVQVGSTLSSGTSTLTTDSTGLSNQLNVRFTPSDRPFPTVDELISEMMKRRDTTERLLRMKVLELQLRFGKAFMDITKDALHNGLTLVMARFGSIVSSIKQELAPYTLGLGSTHGRRAQLFNDDFALQRYIDTKAHNYAKEYAKQYAIGNSNGFNLNSEGKKGAKRPPMKTS